VTAEAADKLRELPDGDATGGWCFAFDAMGCTFGLRIVHPRRDYARQAAWASCAEIDRLEQLFSRFVPCSDISRLNAAAANELVPVSSETIECLQLAHAVCVETAGAFDAVYRSRQRLGAGPALVFDPQARGVVVRVTGLDLDLGGIGKGYALDRAATVLRQWNVAAALLNAGQSTAYGLGRPPSGQRWRVGLRRPDRPDEIAGQVELTDRAVAGSGQRVHGPHILDPRTGQPPARSAAWALAPTAALADALSTAFMVMSTEEIRAYCARHADVAAVIWETAVDSEPTLAGTGSALPPGLCPPL